MLRILDTYTCVGFHSNSINASIETVQITKTRVPRHSTCKPFPPKFEVPHTPSWQSRTEESLLSWDGTNKTEAWKLFHATKHSSSCVFRLVP